MSRTGDAQATTISPFIALKHIVIVLLENHAYDNYFGTYCQALSATCHNLTNGIPSGTCVVLDPAFPNKGCVRPFNFTMANITSPRLVHDQKSSHISWHNGSMNGFYQGEGPTLNTFGHYNGSTIPVYWDLAQKFGLSDSFFSSTLSYSLPNHWYLVAGQAPNITQNHSFVGVNGGNRSEYLKEANATPSAEDLFIHHPKVTWKWYDTPLSSYSTAIGNHPDRNTSVPAYSYWNPQAAKAESYTANLTTHFVARQQFFTDVAAGSLPSVSWLIPAFPASDHAPSDLRTGQGFVASVINSVETSSSWNSTALFVTWDDYGGFYDHVTPPYVNGTSLSFREPLLVISPWTPAGFVSHRTTSFESLLHLIEARWNLGCFTPRDCKAALPTDFFNWSIHRTPVIFQDAGHSMYPYQAPKNPVPFIDVALAANSDIPSED